MRKLSYIALVVLVVACGGGQEELPLPEDDDNRILPGLGGRDGDDDTVSLQDAGSDADLPLDEGTEVDAGPMAGSGGEAGSSGEAGSGEAGSGEAGVGGAGGSGEAGSAGMGEAGSGVLPFEPTHEMFIGQWSWRRDNVPTSECYGAEVSAMMIAAEEAPYDCTSSASCAGELTVDVDFRFDFGSTTTTFDRWEGDSLVGTSTRTWVTPTFFGYEQIYTFWLVNENTMYGFSRPDAVGVQNNVPLSCELFVASRQ